MTTALKTRFDHVQIKPLIGSRVFNDKEALLSGEFADEINHLLEQRGVLVFPEIHFTDAEQIAFTATLGRFAKEIRGEEVFKITLDPKLNAAADYLKGSLYWHIDGTMNAVPIRGSILSSKVLPTWGGNTEFANTYAAYDDLPEDVKEEIADMRVVHSMWNTQLFTRPSRPRRSCASGKRSARRSCRWSGRIVRGASRSCWAIPRNMSSGSIPRRVRCCSMGCASARRRSPITTAMHGASAMP